MSTLKRPLALISNDDGIRALGIQTLADVIAQDFDVYVVAPDRERSGMSHSITISEPLRIEQQPHFSRCQNVYSVTGTPADCVLLALDKILPRKPDLVISGINRGQNLGTDTIYSGTVGAAMEACMDGIRAIAVSTVGHYGDHFHYETAAHVTLTIARRLDEISWHSEMMLNINVPSLPLNALKGIKAAVPGKPLHDSTFYKHLDPTGKPYYWLGSAGNEFESLPDTDCVGVDAGYATVSVLKPSFLDTVYHERLVKLMHQNPFHLGAT